MVPLTSLWLPIVLSAVLVFIASSIIHMVLPYHRSDYGKLPREDEVMEALRKFAIPPGDYLMPRAASVKDMQSPEFKEKRAKGPLAVMTFMTLGQTSMGPTLVKWFLYCLVVSLFAAYVASRALGPGAQYLEVSRFASTTAFTAYALGLWQDTIWYKRAWTTTLKITMDGLIYGFLTGGALGWLWPR